MSKFILPFLVLMGAMLACTRLGPAATPPTVTPVQITPTATTSPNPISTLVSPVATAVPNPQSQTIRPFPTIVAEVDLGIQLEQPLQHSIALDKEGGRIFVGAPPDKTLVLSMESLRITDTLPVGGGVAIDRTRQRLFVGAPGGVAVYDLKGLGLIGTIPITAGLFGSTPIADEKTDTLFVVNNGVYIADPTLRWVRERISGTFPVSITINSGPYATDAALDAQSRRLYISLNNGIPGSNNGNTLMVYDLKSEATVYQDGERSIVSLEADESSGRLFLTRSRMDTSSFSVLANEGGAIKPELRINGIAGQVKLDARRGRIYIASLWDPTPRLLVLDSTTGTLMGQVPLPRAYTFAAFEPALAGDADRLYFVSPDGHLLVMSGHDAEAPTPQPFEPTRVLSGSVGWVAPSPDFANDGIVFAAWAAEGQASSEPFGSLGGRLLASTDGGATWGRVRGGLPPDLAVNALAFSPDFARDQTLFAALLAPDGGGGIYVSNDAGQSWRPATSGLDDWIVAEIAVAPGFPFNRTVFALTRQGGLFRSTDGGQTWQHTSYSASLPVALNARVLAISPDFVNDKTLVVSSGESASISRDGGDNWWPLLEDRATALAFSPDYARDHTLLGSFVDAGVLRSDDGGTTWQAASRGLRFDLGSRVALALSPDFSRDPIAGAAFALVQSFGRTTLYRTVDGGASWQIESSGVAGNAQITTLAVSPDWAHDGLIFIGLNDARLRAIKVSDLKWSNAPAELDKLNVEAIAVSQDFARDPPGGAVFIGSGRTGVFVSTDGGRAWQETNFPARYTGVGRLQLALSPGYADDRVVFASAGGQVFRSDDGGATWQSLLSGLGSYFPVSALAVSPQFSDDRVVLAGGGYQSPRVMRSTDGGQTWSATSGLGQNGGVSALSFVPGAARVAYAWADQSGLYRSGDGGITWTRVFSPTEANWVIQSLAYSPDFAHDRLMFLGVVGGSNFRRSADGGTTWHPSDSGLPSGLIWGSAIAISPDFTRDRTIFLGTDKGVFRSDDGGVTWKASSTGLPQGTDGRPASVLSLALSPDFVANPSGGAIFAGLVDGGLYVSTDGGATWKAER